MAANLVSSSCSAMFEREELCYLQSSFIWQISNHPSTDILIHSYLVNVDKSRLRFSRVVFSSPFNLWYSESLVIICLNLRSCLLTPVLSTTYLICRVNHSINRISFELTVRIWPILTCPVAGFLYMSNTFSSKLIPLKVFLKIFIFTLANITFWGNHFPSLKFLTDRLYHSQDECV